ncbi:MAG: hypothetical protein WAW11_04785 [Patescibacteria group bacterium]
MKRKVVLIIGAVLLVIGALTAAEVLPLSYLGLEPNVMASRGIGFLEAVVACVVLLIAPEKKTS